MDMPKRNEKKASELKGLNIYQDPKHGTVLYDWLTKKGYQLTTSDVKTFGLSQAFLPVAIVLTFFCYSTLKLNFIPSILIGAIAYFVMRLIYRIKFLNNLPFIDNYKKPDNGNIFKNMANNYSKIRLITLLILAVALVGVTGSYLILNSPQGNEKITIIFLLIASIFVMLLALISLIVKKRSN